MPPTSRNYMTWVFPRVNDPFPEPLYNRDGTIYVGECKGTPHFQEEPHGPDLATLAQVGQIRKRNDEPMLLSGSAAGLLTSCGGIPGGS